MTIAYNDPEYLANRATVLASAPLCEGYPKGIHGRERVRATTADHRVPLSQGGTHAIENLDPMCGSCNSRKGVDERPRNWR
jgi:5-methylcytosine-specific restriction endonuclease McrA